MEKSFDEAIDTIKLGILIAIVISLIFTPLIGIPVGLFAAGLIFSH